MTIMTRAARPGIHNPPRCPYCAELCTLVAGTVIYPRRPDLAPLKYWDCRPCDAYCGTHANSPRHAPLGAPANKPLRLLRHRVHLAFDPIWRRGTMRRFDAYAWLARQLGMTQKKCHVGFFNEDQATRALEILRALEHSGQEIAA